MAKIKLSEIIGQFLDEQNYGDAEYRKAYSMAIRCLRNEIETDIQGKIYKTKLCIGKDKTACLPDNFVKEIEVDYSERLNDNIISDSDLDAYITGFKQPYTVDTKRGIILFDTNYEYDEIDFIYFGREELCGDAEIDDRLCDTIVAYLTWKFESGKRSTSSGEKDRLMREFYRVKDNAKFRIGRPSNQQMLRSSRIHEYYGIKR